MATANKFASGKLQASMIKFHTTVPGSVIVKFANTGSKTEYRYLVVNGVQSEARSKDATTVTYAEYVPAGDVVLTVFIPGISACFSGWSKAQILSYFSGQLSLMYSLMARGLQLYFSPL